MIPPKPDKKSQNTKTWEKFRPRYEELVEMAKSRTQQVSPVKTTGLINFPTGNHSVILLLLLPGRSISQSLLCFNVQATVRL